MYQPTITSQMPPGWQGAPFDGHFVMLTPRWDSAKYLRNSTGAGKPENRGGASFAYLATLHYSTKAGAPERAVAQHIKKAFTKPDDTKPFMTVKHVMGQTPEEALHRLQLDTKRRTANWKASVKQCKRYWGDNYTQGGLRECDEYPFQSTYEGAAVHDYDPDAKKFNFSVQPLAKADNGAAGNLLNGFYTKNRLIDGPDDGFMVKVD
ncbi:NucA/NucB deoxyribonuclease domain-containing protein [Streptomyces pinistramenti]|uniref:NucA/NucB deoxyribonuclease domain-containing protein n=1 Tax=Streptomyces pinistramenti TaxID=2884812 RepID=UPI001D076E14|nr:hypothetical protein [Streptomyces pinistramenti]MCB5905897.1 hypothetical protein [Streptomyces pinistramenti]